MTAAPLRQIKRRFDFNVERVSNLLILHSGLKKNEQYREYRGDLLRSAVVFLHATLEDLVRELLRAKASLDPSFLYKRLQFRMDSVKPEGKVDVAYLAGHRGKTVDDVISDCVALHLEQRTFNNIGDLKTALRELGFKNHGFEESCEKLRPAIQRRHKIVHEGDREAYDNDTHGVRHPIRANEVEEWLNALREFGNLLLENSGQASAAERESK